MGLGYGTMVATPNGEAAIERIGVGDQVLVRSGGEDASSWSAAAVKFSAGADGYQPRMSFLRFEDHSELVCDTRQPLLRADNRLVRAARLVPGDRLLGPDGASRELVFHGLGGFTAGVHSIAFADSWNGSPDGHLIGAGGVIAGDYLVELHLKDEG
jgi:hypothetical protein